MNADQSKKMVAQLMQSTANPPSKDVQALGTMLEPVLQGFADPDTEVEVGGGMGVMHLHVHFGGREIKVTLEDNGPGWQPTEQQKELKARRENDE